MPTKLVVEFRQRFTVKPPEEIDPDHADQWFWNIYNEIGYDLVDTSRSDHYEILSIDTTPEEEADP